MVSNNDLDTLAASLKNEADKLNKAFPSVNEMLSRADEKLADADPGVEVWMADLLEHGPENKLWGPDDPQTGESDLLGKSYYAYQVGFARVPSRQPDDAWGLAARVVDVREFDRSNEKKVIGVTWHKIGGPIPITGGTVVAPISNAPMSVRIEALRLVPGIFQALLAVARRRNLAIEEAKKQLKVQS